MNGELKLERKIYELECSLLKSSVRTSAEKLDGLLLNDFIEFGSSGKKYSKNDILERLPNEEPSEFVVSDFSINQLSKEVVLATYEVSVNSVWSLRSSIWKNVENQWGMIFHQGTKKL
ncbi:MAG: DUF4440 domain-containing protein [Francisellaceae bacterium]|jgi:hypothetical protein|nr:DUF4440 domain-containing protein [Francisellaceae bacterium]MBT6538407.1 DUF4440 domain-containing protein [Francisellaceae bacterium]